VTASVENKERTYGGWRRPASPGIGPLKLFPSIALMGGLALTLLVSMVAGLWWALGFAFLALLGAAPAVVPYHGRTLYAEWSKTVQWHRHQRRGHNLYRSGLAGVTPSGTRALPGLLAKVNVWDATDAIGRDFALIEVPASRQWAVVLRVAAQGGALVDTDTTDVWVAEWGEYLTMLGEEGGVVQAAAVVETIPNAGALLRSHVSTQVRTDAPEFARRVAFAGAEELHEGVADTIGHVALTFSEKGLGIDRKGNEQTAAAVAEEVGRRLPGLSVGLKAAGASEGLPLSVDALARRAREAFDPLAAIEFAESESEGVPAHVEWTDAGPSAHDETWMSYRHDSGLSRTYEALKVPPGVVRDSLMERLMGPLDSARRKRVTMLYRPVDAGDTANVVDTDYKSALNRAGRRKGIVHAHDSADVRSAEQATKEEADGAGVVTFSVMVTVTVTDDAEFDRACTAVERAARRARLRLSPVRGAQAAAFAGALGIGLSLPDLSVLPHVARQHF